MESTEKHNKLISVIMLTHNRENYVERMIKCILDQTMKDYEFIIVDNGSSDRSGAIADAYAAKDDRIKVIHRADGTIGAGRNTGLDAAQGKYIAFVDDDDTCTPDFLEFLYNLIVETSADVAICGASWSGYVRDERLLMNGKEAVEMLLWRKNYNAAFPTKLFRRELFADNRFPKDGKYEDIYLMPKMLAEADKVIYHGLAKYHFEKHDNNNSAWALNHKLLDLPTLKEYLEVYDQRTEWLVNKFPTDKDKWQYFNFSFMVSMVEKVTRLELKDCYDLRDHMKKVLRENYEEFYNCPYILDFEKDWMDKYVVE